MFKHTTIQHNVYITKTPTFIIKLIVDAILTVAVFLRHVSAIVGHLQAIELKGHVNMTYKILKCNNVVYNLTVVSTTT
jgi:hypothetical protein